MVLVGILGALPTLVHAIWEPSLIVDDWEFAALASDEGLGGFLAGSDVRSRPLQALYHGVTFVGLGDRPFWHLVLLAVLNGVAAVLVLRVARAWVDSRSALLIAVVWVSLANRGASRLWISTGPVVLAMVLLLLAAHLASRRHPAWILATALVVASTLSYEGGVLIGLAVVVVAAWRAAGPDRRRRIGQCGGAAAAVGVTALLVLVFSPKGSAGASSPGAALSALIGRALFPRDLGPGQVVCCAVLLVAAGSAVVADLRRRGTVRLLAAGTVLAALGAAPFLASGFPLSTDGMLDRGHTFATFGIAVLVAAAVNQLWGIARPIGAGAAMVCLLLLALANLDDLRDVHAAERDGESAVAALARLDALDGETIVLAPLPNHGGYVALGYGAGTAALRLRSGRDMAVVIPFDEAEFDRSSGRRIRYDPRTGSLVEVDASDAEVGMAVPGSEGSD